ncbi:MAG: ribosome recycling factor [Actinomycetaceae bacterium]|nr:ribosome recycling factor [Actinomycetaceae bacterium]MDY6082984.1 ribosome recycling factor [Actinomycetaceae bacterium]
MIDDVLLDAEDKMEKAVEATQNEFAAIRSGRANAAMFNPIMVEYYGAQTPLQQLASIAVPEARLVLITPYDRTAMHAIEKAIAESDLGLNPTDDGNVLRINMPPLTEERRKEYVKLARAKSEDGKVSVRSARRRALDALEKIKKDGEAGEDEVKRAQDQVETLTKQYVDKVDGLLDKKEKELLEV